MMKMSMRWLAAAAACFSLTSLAAAGTNGTYVMDGGAYSINVEFVPEGLQIVEPNKTSLYTPTSVGVYEFTNPNNGIMYGIRVIDDSTIEAFKPGSGQAGTVLKLSGASAMTIDEDNPNYAQYKAIADKYADLSATDPDNVQVWAACGAAALAFMHMSTEDALQVAGQSAMLLKSMMTNASSTPCDDAIPASVW